MKAHDYLSVMPSDVITAGALDSSHATDSIIVVGWVLDQVIDPEKLKNAWSSLVGAWPILVSRLRKSNKSWEYHIPRDASVAGSFSALQLRGTVDAHYCYSKPAPNIQCTSKENPLHLFVPNCPPSVSFLLDSDLPISQLNVTLFDDASLIGLAVPHILCDGHGVTILMKALCDILSGGPPPPPLPREDPYASFAINTTTVPSPPYWRALTRVQIVLLYLRSFIDWVFDGRIENRDLFIPKAEADRLKSEAMEDIHKEYGRDTKHWISTSDVILAFCLKCIYADSVSNSPMNVFYTVNLRTYLPLPEPFIHNSVSMIITPTLPLSYVNQFSLGKLALHIRQTIVDQGTKPAVETWLRWRLQNSHRTKIFFSPWSGLWNVVTNWRDMKLMNLDFTPALREHGGPGKVNCVYLWGNGIQPIPLRNWIGLWADDPRGGIWVSAFLPKKIWWNKNGFGKYIPI